VVEDGGVLSHGGWSNVGAWAWGCWLQVKANQRDTSWETYTCTLGFPVMGIWPSGSDGTDVNSLDRSRSQRYIATADDLGLVKLFNYPCVMKDPGCRYVATHLLWQRA
jgi:microtubule-associated protein-like 6